MVLSLADAAFVTTPTNALWNRAGAYPTLDLRFSENKSLVDAVTGSNLVTFTRASDATYIGSDGLLKTATTNEPRFDHNPLTGESLGLLVEEQRTNLLLRSEEFDNASWAKLNSVTITANAIAAPNGAITADKIVEPASSADKPVVQFVNLAASTTYTASVYFKAAERPTILFHVRKIDYITRFGGFFNTSTNTFTPETASGGVLDSFVFRNIGNGWYQCSITGNIGANTVGIVTIYMANSSNNINYTGDGTSGLYLWGAQLEAGAFPTSYIPTTDSAATRNADVASITGANFSSWYRQDEGTMFASGDFANAGAASFSRVVSLTGENTGTDEISLYTRLSIGAGDGSIYGAVTVDSSLQGELNSPIGSPILSGGYRSAIAYKANDFGLSSNGLTPTTDASGTLPTITQLIIMGNVRFQDKLSGHIRRLTYWTARLPNATLQALTV